MARHPLQPTRGTSLILRKLIVSRYKKVPVRLVNVIHKIVWQSGMESQLEIEDYVIIKVRVMAISPENSVPIPNKNFKAYILDGRQLGIACGKFPVGID